VLLILPVVPSLLAAPTASDAQPDVRLTIPPACPPSEDLSPHFSRPSSCERTDDAFAPGDLVVLLKDNRPACPELKAGQAGTIICRRNGIHPGEFLVNWVSGNIDIGAGACGTTEPVIFSPGSAVWIDPNEVPLGRPFDECGTLRNAPEGCVLLEAETGRVYNLLPADELSQTLEAASEIQCGNRVRVRGLINTTPPGFNEIRTRPQADGDIHYPLITLDTATEEGCCAATIGDRIIPLHKDREASNRLFGHTTVTLQLDFRGRLAVDVTPATLMGGTWQGCVMPELAGPGTASVRIFVQAEDIDAGDPPPDSGIPTAEVSLVVIPAE